MTVTTAAVLACALGGSAAAYASTVAGGRNAPADAAQSHTRWCCWHPTGASGWNLEEAAGANTTSPAPWLAGPAAITAKTLAFSWKAPVASGWHPR